MPLQHISTLEFALAPRSKTFQLRNADFLGPFFQGALMEHVDGAYGEYLHQLPFNPYSQFVVGDESSGRLVWRVCALNDEAARQLLHPISGIDAVVIRALNEVFDVVEMKIGQVRMKELTDVIYSSDGSRISIRFITPSSFKSRGEYVIVPSARLIFQNLLMRYEQVYSGNKEVDPETIDFLAEHSRISSYRLRSRYFANIGGKSGKIPAFTGELTLSFTGPQTVAGMAKMLLKFGEYSGLGIKTSMGMGAIGTD